ncbi:hypothetical protein L917_10056, partial [Phytophthora nicotianae]
MAIRKIKTIFQRRQDQVPSAENIADIFTKALGPCVFERLRSQLNVATWRKHGKREIGQPTKLTSKCVSKMAEHNYD